MANDNHLLAAGVADDKSTRENDGFDIDLVELLYRLLEKVRWLIIAAVIGALLAGIYTYQFVKPTYQATSRLYILNSKDSVVNLTDLQMGSNLAADYVQAFTAYRLHQRVKDELGLDYSIPKMASMVRVANRSGTRILNITVTSTNPEEAVRMADAYLAAGQDFIEEVMGTSKPRVFETAESRGVPTVPSAPDKVRNILLGFVIGFAIAAVVIIVQFIVDDRVRNSEILEKRLGLPVLGMMPATNSDDLPGSSGSSGHKPQHKLASGRKGGAK